MTHEKRSPMDSIDKNEAGGRVFVVTEFRGPHVRPSPWVIDLFLSLFTEISFLLQWYGSCVAHFMTAKETTLLLWTGCEGTHMNDCHDNMNAICIWLNDIEWNEKEIALKKKCNVATKVGMCLQHVTAKSALYNAIRRRYRITLGPFYEHNLPGIKTYVRNYIQGFLWNVFNLPCTNYDVCLIMDE